jgi:hypothetical protein
MRLSKPLLALVLAAGGVAAVHAEGFDGGANVSGPSWNRGGR